VQASQIEVDKFGKAKLQRFQRSEEEDEADSEQEMGFNPSFTEVDRILAKKKIGGWVSTLTKMKKPLSYISSFS